MLTQTLTEASLLLETVLIDLISLYNVGELETDGIDTHRPMTLIEADVPGLVQATSLQNAVESATQTTWSVKVARTQPIEAGQAVKVLRCAADPSLVGKTLYLEKVSSNGMALIRKAVASDTYNVDQQGKEGLS